MIIEFPWKFRVYLMQIQFLEELGTPGTLEFKTTEGETFMTGEMVADAQAATDTSKTSSSKYVVQFKTD